MHAFLLAAVLITPPIHCAVLRIPFIASRGVPAAPPIAVAGASAGALSSAPPVLPPYLAVANPADAAQVARIVAAAQESPTARKVLAEVAAMSASRGKPVVVESARIPEAGTYNYDWGILSMRRKDLGADPRENLSTLIHELVHYLQRDLPLPSDLLETELEAYLVDFRVARELGLKPVPGSYDDRSQRAFKRGVQPFVDFLVKEYPEDGLLWKNRSRNYEDRLKAGLARSTAKLEKAEAERARKLQVLEQMRGLGHSEAELQAYREDSVTPLDSAVRGLNRAIAWARQDLALLSDPESRKAVRAYVRGIIRKARAFQPVFAGR